MSLTGVALGSGMSAATAGVLGVAKLPSDGGGRAGSPASQRRGGERDGPVVVCGGGVVVLCVAVMLARDGQEVTVLETDPDGAPAPPAEAWSSWRRTGVAQFHQPHIPFPGFGEKGRWSCPGCWTACGRRRGVGGPAGDAAPGRSPTAAASPGGVR